MKTTRKRPTLARLREVESQRDEALIAYGQIRNELVEARVLEEKANLRWRLAEERLIETNRHLHDIRSLLGLAAGAPVRDQILYLQNAVKA